jgi:hypothetical protein
MPTSLRDDDLYAYLFGAATHALSARCAAWMAASPRFRAFVADHRDKIRRKVRSIRDDEGLSDLQLELDTAYRLLQERRFTLAYEQYLAGKTRGPDFTVTFKTRARFNVEVKRLRSSPQPGRWADVICDKLDQLPPSIANVLLVATDADTGDAFDVAHAMAELRAVAERKDDDFFARRGLAGARDYLRRSQRLSAVVYRLAWSTVEARSLLWINPQAKHPLPHGLPVRSL